jgi:hypothetical protein
VAADDCGITTIGRGVKAGQGARNRGEGPAPAPAFGRDVHAIDSLEELSGWLGTFRERLAMARAGERAGVAELVNRLEARYPVRRAELS